MNSCKLTEEKVVDLINNVVFPSSTIVMEECKDLDKRFKFKMALTKLALILLMPDKEKIRIFKNKGIALKNLHILDEEKSNKILKQFFLLHSEWENLNCQIALNDDENGLNDEDFFDFDSEEIDESINNMHYEEKDKISASEFMQKYGIDEDFKLELNDLMLEVEEFIYQYEDVDIDIEFIEKLQFLEGFIKAFEFSGEFIDIGYGLEVFRNKILSLELEELNLDQKNLLKIMILSTLSDLSKWVDEVIINQTAQDIHYVDASLLANIAQIDIMIKSNENSSDEDDELELF